MKNTCEYSDNWQPYIGDYDKFEYDVKLANGTIIENCYPNAGKFAPMFSNENKVLETDVVEIRFSNSPKMYLNNLYSEFECKYESTLGIDSEYIKFDNIGDSLGFSSFGLSNSIPQYIRVEPKIGNNDPCKCGSGKKFKKCCKNK